VGEKGREKRKNVHLGLAGVIISDGGHDVGCGGGVGVFISER
jgi:hypothetical protein